MSEDINKESFEHISEVIDNNPVKGGIYYKRTNRLGTDIYKSYGYEIIDEITNDKYSFTVDKHRGKPETYEVRVWGRGVDFPPESKCAEKLYRKAERRQQEGLALEIVHWLSDAQKIEYDPSITKMSGPEYPTSKDVVTVKYTIKDDAWVRLCFDKTNNFVFNSKHKWYFQKDLFDMILRFTEYRIARMRERIGQKSR